MNGDNGGDLGKGVVCPLINIDIEKVDNRPLNESILIIMLFILGGRGADGCRWQLAGVGMRRGLGRDVVMRGWLLCMHDGYRRDWKEEGSD